MKLIIDIPEEIYESQRYEQYFGAWSVVLQKHFENGTPLPKGHGRLIDADKLKPEARFIREDGVVVYVPAVPIMKVVNAPTIVEADKENEE